MCLSVSRSVVDSAQHRLVSISSSASLSGLTCVSVCLPSVLTLASPLCKPQKPPHRAEPEAGSSSDPWADGATWCPSRGARLAPPPGAGGPGSAERRRRHCRPAGAGLRLAPSRAAPPREPCLSSRLPQRPAAVTPRPRSTEQPGRRGRRISKLSPEPAPVSRSRCGRGAGRGGSGAGAMWPGCALVRLRSGHP